MARHADDGVQAEIQVRNDIADEDRNHVVAGIGQRCVARAEEAQDRIEEDKGDGHEQEADQHVQNEDIAEHFLGHGVILLPEQHGNQGGAAYADKRAESGGQVHQREGQCEA